MRRLAQAAAENAYGCPNPVAIRFCADQSKTNAAISAELVVPVKICRAVISGQQQIEIAVAIEVGIGESASNFRLIESAAYSAGDIAELPIATVQK